MNAKKKIIMALVVAVSLLGLSGAASAVNVEFTYTGDNIIDFFIIGGSVTPALDGNADEWRLASSYTADLAPGTYTVEWTVVNWEVPPTTSGPAAFLAQIDTGSGLILTSSAWEVNPYINSVYEGWKAATEYNLNSDPNSIWDNNNGNSAVAGISGDAWWIGSGAFPGETAQFKVRTSFTVSAVPIPGAVWLLGSGLMGLVGLRRKLAA